MFMRGDVYMADLNPVTGSEQGGIRPVVIVQNDQGNRFGPTVIVLALTSQLDKARLPTHVALRAGENGLAKDSVALAEQLRTLDKSRLGDKIGSLGSADMQRVDRALRISLNL